MRVKNLQWQINPSTGRHEKSSILVEFHDLAFHFQAVSNIDGDGLEEVLDFLYKKILSRYQSPTFVCFYQVMFCLF